jgi:3-hydroxyisobutyrate dehydrogenase-like beta-hydroxyacid dehydrogenase
MSRVCVIGAGRIGLPVLTNLASTGHQVQGYDVRPEVREAVEAAGARWFGDARSAAADVDVVLTILPGTPELRDVMLGADRLLGALGPDQLWIDLTSASPALGRELAGAATGAGTGYVDAPLGGGPSAARAGSLTLYVGGRATEVSRAREVFAAIAAPGRIHHLGPSGSGYLAKLLVNLLWFGQTVAVGEALLLGQHHGLEPAAMRELLSAGPAGSDFIDRYLPQLLDGDYLPSFGLDRIVEELRSVDELARTDELPFDVSRAVVRLYENALATEGHHDGELLGIAHLERRAGRHLRGAPSRDG